jgi:hypothetical protein
VGPNFVQPNDPMTQRYTHEEEPEVTIAAESGAQRFEHGAQIAAEWWRLFDCPKSIRWFCNL